MPFSRQSSRPEDPTGVSYVSCVAGGFLTRAEPPEMPRMIVIRLADADGQMARACSVIPVVPDSAALRTVVQQAPLSMAFSRQEHCSGLPFGPDGSKIERA